MRPFGVPGVAMGLGRPGNGTRMKRIDNPIKKIRTEIESQRHRDMEKTEEKKRLAPFWFSRCLGAFEMILFIWSYILFIRVPLLIRLREHRACKRLASGVESIPSRGRVARPMGGK